jgi:hypothetical protein
MFYNKPTRALRGWLIMAAHFDSVPQDNKYNKQCSHLQLYECRIRVYNVVEFISFFWCPHGGTSLESESLHTHILSQKACSTVVTAVGTI